MTTKGISIKDIIEFLREAKFDRLEWDESEITCYHSTGEPFGRSEFLPESKIRQVWGDMELKLSGYPAFAISLKDFPNP